MQDIRRVKGCDASDVWKGLAAGLIGGLVASWMMNRFQDAWSKLAKGMEGWSDNQFQMYGASSAKASVSRPILKVRTQTRTRKFRMTRP